MCTIPTHILVIHKFRIIHFALIFAEIHPVHVTFRLRFQNISSLFPLLIVYILNNTIYAENKIYLSFW